MTGRYDGDSFNETEYLLGGELRKELHDNICGSDFRPYVFQGKITEGCDIKLCAEW